MIRIINRSMSIPIPDRVIGHVGDNLVETRSFELNRYYGEVDLSEFYFKLDTEIDGNKNIIDLDKTVEDDKITLTWTVYGSHVLHAGRMTIQIRAFHDGVEKWHSAQDYVIIRSSINAPDAYSSLLPSEFEQMELRVTTLKEQAEASAQTATEQANRAQSIADEFENETLPAAIAAVEAAVDEQVDIAASHANRAQGIADTFSNTTLPAAISAVEAAGQAKVDLAEQQVERVEDIIQEAEQDVLPELRQAIEDGIETKDQLGRSIQEAGEAKTELDGSISAAGPAKTGLDGSISSAGVAKTQLDGSISSANGIKSQLDGSITTAEQTKQALDESIATGDLDSFKADYMRFKNDSTLKSAKIEKELNDYKATLAGMNPNHEAKQKVSGYSIISLPENAANGQISATVKGRTLTNKLGTGFKDVNNFTQANFEHIGDGFARIVATGAYVNVYFKREVVNLQPSTDYTIIAEIRENTLNGTYSIASAGAVGDPFATSFTVSPYQTGIIIEKVTTKSDLTGITVGLRTYVSAASTSGEIEVRLMMFEGDLTNEEGINYIDGTKSTVGAMRLKSVGKNLLDAENYVDGFAVSATSTPPGQIRSIAGRFGYIIPIIPTTTYTISRSAVGASSYCSTGFTSQYPQIGDYIDSYESHGTSLSSTVTSPASAKYLCIFFGTGLSENVQVEKGAVASAWEEYKKAEVYINAGGELRSLPNGTKDEVSVTDRKLIKRIGEKSNITNGMVIDFADMAEGGTYYAWNEDGETETGIKGDTLGIDATTLIYQLAEPVEIPIEVSGNIVSYPSGTIYIERAVPDAGIYTDKMTVLHQDLPIKVLEKLSKIDFTTGLETELDVSDAIIAEDKLSFTHPDLVDGDIVFFTYEYDRGSTEGETEIEYYDSRYVIKDSVTNKFYKWHIAVAEGVPSIELVEV